MLVMLIASRENKFRCGAFFSVPMSVYDLAKFCEYSISGYQAMKKSL